MKRTIRKSHLFVISMLAMAVAMPSAPILAQDSPAESVPNSPTYKTAWGAQSADIKPDESIRYGVLSNGMKYALKKNETPKGNASLRMHVALGSIAEAEEERGLSHFLEHMAFNGSNNVAEGEMIKLLERLGLSFGADTNAYTSFDETVYELDLPRTDTDTVDTSLFLMRETASELTISDEAVERERGVVDSERQFRNTASLRYIESLLKFALPDAPFGNRLPIGTENVLKTAPASAIRNLYERYYRPENTTLVMVGDFDVNAIEAKIKQTFGDWQGVGEPGAPLDRGTVGPAQIKIGSFSDPAVNEEVQLTILSPYERTDDSIDTVKTKLLENLASSIMGQRFQKLSLVQDAKINGGRLVIGDLFGTAQQVGLSLNPKDGQWQDALAVGEQELRRAVQFGFTQSELNQQLANLETRYKNRVDQADTRSNQAIATEIIGTIYDKSIVSTPQSDLEIFTALKPLLTPEAVTSHFQSKVNAPPSFLYVSTKEPIDNVQARAFSVLTESRNVAVAPPEQVIDKAFAYDDFGTPSKITADSVIDDLDIRTIIFENGVKLNIKKTDFERGRVRYSLRYGGGTESLSQDQGSIGVFLASMAAIGGLKEHSFEELQRIVAGKSVNLTLTAGLDNFGASAITTPADLELQMKILAAFVTDGGYREEIDTAWQNIVPSFAAQLDALPQSISRFELPRVLHGGDKRYGIASAEELLAYKASDLEALLSPLGQSAPIEIAIVGDVDEQTAIDAVADSFGALAKRDETLDVDIVPPKIITTKDDITLYHKGEIEQGLFLSYWPSTDGKDQKSNIERELASAVFRSLLLDEVREKLGATYSPNANSVASTRHDGYGYMSASVIAAPDKMVEINEAITAITAKMIDEGIDADMLERARKPMIEELEKQERENGNWLFYAQTAQSKPEILDRKRNEKALILAVTPSDIQSVAEQYLTETNRFNVRIVSDKTKTK